MMLSKLLRELAGNPHGNASVDLADAMNQAADALEGKTLSDEKITYFYYNAVGEENVMGYVTCTRACLEHINTIPR